MITVDDLLTLPGAPLAETVRITEVDTSERQSVTRYQGLRDLEAFSSGQGARVFLRGGDVVLVYLGSAALSDGIDHDALVAALGSEGHRLRSRQGKTASMHVVAERGVAWSEHGGEIGFVELFSPTSFADYERDIYAEPPRFRR